MPHDDLMDDLDVRLRQSRPDDADVDADAFDADLLARVRSTPMTPRSVARRPTCCPVAGVTVVATAAVAAHRRPRRGAARLADAITPTLHWLDPPDGTILHARSVETDGDQTLTREFWQSADDSNLRREVFQGSENFETAGDETFYVAATNTIYDAPKGAADKPRADGTPRAGRSRPRTPPGDAAKAAKLRAEGKAPVEADGGLIPAPSSDTQRAKADEAAANGVGEANEPLPVGDPVVVKVRMSCRTTG